MNFLRYHWHCLDRVVVIDSYAAVAAVAVADDEAEAAVDYVPCLLLLAMVL